MEYSFIKCVSNNRKNIYFYIYQLKIWSYKNIKQIILLLWLTCCIALAGKSGLGFIFEEKGISSALERCLLLQPWVHYEIVPLSICTVHVLGQWTSATWVKSSCSLHAGLQDIATIQSILLQKNTQNDIRTPMMKTYFKHLLNMKKTL